VSSWQSWIYAGTPLLHHALFPTSTQEVDYPEQQRPIRPSGVERSYPLKANTNNTSHSYGGKLVGIQWNHSYLLHWIVLNGQTLQENTINLPVVKPIQAVHRCHV
jgi:hypothetical protein